MMKSSVLKEIIIDSMKEILSLNLPTDDTYIAVKRLFSLDEFELRILLGSVGKIKQAQIEQEAKAKQAEIDQKRMNLLR